MPSRVRRNGQRRVQADRGPQLGDRRLQAPVAFERDPEVVARFGVAGPQRDGGVSAGSAPARSRVHQRVAPR